MRNLHKTYTLSVVFLLHAFFTTVQADEFDDVAMAIDKWQYKRLFNPTPADLKDERHGSIIVYYGLTDITVKEALDEHFDRIQNMMFARTVVTDTNGEPLIDKETGKKVLEDGDCD